MQHQKTIILFLYFYLKIGMNLASALKHFMILFFVFVVSLECFPSSPVMALLHLMMLPGPYLQLTALRRLMLSGPYLQLTALGRLM